MRHVTEEGIKFIQKWEGTRLNIYNDIAGYPSIGVGHRILPGEQFSQGISNDEAANLLKSDLQIAERSVLRLIAIPLADNQFSALVSFSFNLGGGCLQRSTLRRKINRNDSIDEIKAEFAKWCFAGHIKSKGLLRRRQAEAELYASA